MSRLIARLIITASLIYLAACQHSQPISSSEMTESDAYQLSRYDVDNDFSPEKKLRPEHIKDAIPREEKRSRGGNYSPYSVFGKSYEVMSDDSAKVYKEEGGASWYGLKFHGHKTSNGEIYDIYQMTAAHKTLPIPSYARVTNLKNQRSCVVRVNDRGPFHEGRIIDLSYSAATKLGYIGTGTAQVLVEAIDAKAWLAKEKLMTMLAEAEKEQTIKSSAVIVEKPTLFLQVGAYSEQAIAQEKYQQLFAILPHPIFLESGIDLFYRLKIGPLQGEELDQVQSDLAAAGYPPAYLVKTRNKPNVKPAKPITKAAKQS